MKILKLFLLSILSFSCWSQLDPCQDFSANLQISDALNIVSCDGQAFCNVSGGTAPYSFNWSIGNNISANINVFLCAGPICCIVTDSNGCSYETCDTISTENSGDTLVINNGGSSQCNSPVSSIDIEVEDCILNYNSLDTAFLGYTIPSVNLLDSFLIVWYVVLENNIYYPIETYIEPITTNGCYDLSLTVYCQLKSLNYNTVIINGSFDFNTSSINELELEKQIIRKVDLMGREVDENQTGIVIYHYSDGSIKKYYKN